MSYVDDFMKLKCAGDVLNTVNPISNKTSKEITESMSIIKYLKKIVLKRPMEYELCDLCAGNALTSVLAMYLLPLTGAIAIDIRERKRRWYLCDNFCYINKDIYQIYPNFFKSNSIIISVHPCSKLAERVIELYLQSKARHLILMPCCNGKLDVNYPDIIREKLGKYVLWSWQLTNKCKGKFTIDEKVLSPKNIVIIASKEK